jgi:PAS domain-containing protein
VSIYKEGESMHEQETFASRLTKLIREHSISHAEVGRVVGVSGQAVGKWAKGGNIEYENLKALAKHLSVNWIWLRYGDDAMISFSERRTGSKARRAVIKEIMENEQRLRLTLNAVNIGTWDLDLVDDWLVLSSEARQLLDMEGNNSFRGNKDDLLERVDTGDQERVGKLLDQVLDGRLAEFDFTHKVTEGGRQVHHRGKVIKDDLGRPVRVVGVIARV